MEAAFKGQLNRRISVDRHTYQRNEALEIVQVYARVFTEVPAAIQPLGTSARQTVAGLYPEASAKLYVEWTWDIHEGDRVVDEEAGQSYIVLGVEDAAGRQHHLEAWLAAQNL